jgi:hypothetical protein
VESLLFHFLEQGETWKNNRKKAWERLRTALQIDREFIDRLEEVGTPQRHGALVPLAAEDRIELIGRVWLIVERFVTYLKNDSKVLPADTYPVLKPRKFKDAKTVVEEFQQHAAGFKALALVVRFGNRCEAIPSGFENPLKRLEEMMNRGGRAIGYAGIRDVPEQSKGYIWPIEPYNVQEVDAHLRAMLQRIGKMGGVDFGL